MKEKGELETIAYLLGIISIVLAFFQPLPALILGIIGFIHAKKQKTPLAKKAKKLNLLGIVISIIIIALTMGLAAYLTLKGVSGI